MYHFEKTLEGPCPNHAFPAKHLYKECGLMRKYLAGGLNKGEQGKEPVPTTDDAEEKDDAFPTPTGALMIFGGSTVYDSKRRQKLACRKVYTVEPAAPSFLRWLESTITFDRTNHSKKCSKGCVRTMPFP